MHHQDAKEKNRNLQGNKNCKCLKPPQVPRSVCSLTGRTNFPTPRTTKISSRIQRHSNNGKSSYKGRPHLVRNVPETGPILKHTEPLAKLQLSAVNLGHALHEAGYNLLRANVLEGADLLLSHGRHHRHNKIFPLTKSILNLSEETVISWEFQVILSIAILSQ